MSDNDGRPSHAPASPGWMEHWRRIARRVRVPLGFVAAGFYLWRLWIAAPQAQPILWSLVLVLPGVWLRGYAAGYVKKNQELTQTGPYGYTRNPLYLGSMMIAAGFAIALLSWIFAVLLLLGFALIYVPVIHGEESFLRRTFTNYDEYCARVPRLLPRLTSARRQTGNASMNEGRFSLARYRRHREYRSMLGVVLLYGGLLAARLLHLHGRL